ncbi:MAG: thioesterase family protein, partial [Litorimonas sp.]
MSQSFADLAAQVPHGAPDIPDSWKQGRTAYGGLSAALLLSRARADAPDLPALRSALVNFTGPVTDAPELSSEVLRQGRNVTTVATRAEEAGRTVCTATFSFGAARESHLRVDRPAPNADAPENYERFDNVDSPFVPAFLRNFDVHLVEGQRPLQGAERGYLRCWARHRDAASHGTEAGLLCLADILPPSAFPIMTKLGPVSSMTWICNLLRDPATEDGWYQVEAELSAALDGYCSQVMRMWNSRGELVVEG